MLHTSGHAYRGDLRIMMELTKPKHVMPLHGELFMRQSHKELAQEMGVPKANAHLIENGDALELLKGKVRCIKGYLQLIDKVIEKGFEGEMDDPVITERNTMKENGVVMIMLKVDKRSRKLMAHPRVITRGFVFKSLSGEWSKVLTRIAGVSYEKVLERANTQKKQKDLVHVLRMEISRQITQKYDKTPLVLPVFIEQ